MWHNFLCGFHSQEAAYGLLHTLSVVWDPCEDLRYRAGRAASSPADLHCCRAATRLWMQGSGSQGNQGWRSKLDCCWLAGCGICLAVMQLCSERPLHLAFIGLRATDTHTASACRDLRHVLCSLLLHSPQRHVRLYAGMCGLLTLLNPPKAGLSVAKLCLAGSCRVASTLATWQLVRVVPAKCM